MKHILSIVFPFFSAYIGFSAFWYIENTRNHYREQLKNYNVVNDLLLKISGSALFVYSGYSIGVKISQYYLK